MRSSHTRGFTLIELIMVATIIGLIAAIVLSSLSESRSRARNTNTLEQIRQYQKALDLVLSDDGVYPSSADSGTVYGCLGDYPAPNTCWNAGNISESTNLANQLLPYIKLPPGTHTIGAYRGYIYRSLNSGSNYEMQWVLEGGAGAAAHCDFPATQVVGQNLSGNTICIYTHPN